MKTIKLKATSNRPPRPQRGEVLSYLGFTLRYKDGTPARVGDPIELNGESFTLTGGNPPHKPSSSGFIWIEDSDERSREYYASVIDTKWTADA